MNETTSPAKAAVQYGVIFGVIMILEFVIPYAVGINLLENKTLGLIINLANYLFLPIILIFIALNNYKKNINNGFLSFNQALKGGVTLVVIAALIFALFTVVFNLIFPEYLVEIMSSTRKMMAESNPSFTEEQLDTSIAMIEKFSTPYITVPATIAIYAFIGLIYSLIIGAILKNDQPKAY